MAKEKMLSTQDIKTGGMPKTIEPGEHVLKITQIRLHRFDFMEAGKYHLLLETETKPVADPNFEGFFLDVNDESKGRHAGQVGTIKMTYWPFADAVLKDGKEISRDVEIMKAIKNICVAAGCLKWFTGNKKQYQTIEELVEDFNTQAPFKDKYIRFCVAGKEYAHKTTGFMKYDLYLPKPVKGRFVYEPEITPLSKLVKFNPDEHIIRQSQNIEKFGNSEGLEGKPIDPLSTDLGDAPFDL